MKFQVGIALLTWFVAQAAFGQEPSRDSEAEAETSSQSGYEDLAEIGGSESISADIEITQRFDQVWTVGAGWANPSERTFGPGLDNETVLETSYKFQLSKNFSLTPDLQVVFNPANDPSEDSVWVFGLRVIFTM